MTGTAKLFQQPIATSGLEVEINTVVSRGSQPVFEIEGDTVVSRRLVLSLLRSFGRMRWTFSWGWHPMLYALAAPQLTRLGALVWFMLFKNLGFSIANATFPLSI